MEDTNIGSNSNNNNNPNNRMNQQTNSLPWNKLWNLNIPQKIKHFIWKACHEAIPIKMNLIKKGINTNPICNIYNKENETTLHRLVTCSETRKIWYASTLSLRITDDESEKPNFQIWLMKWLTMNNIKNKEKNWTCEYIAILCWHI